MLITHKKLQPLQCYHIFSDSRDVYLSKNCYEHYSPRMVPVAENSGSGSWLIYKLRGKNSLSINCQHKVSHILTHFVNVKKTIMQGIVVGEKAEESQDNDGRKTSQIRLVRWQQQAEWQRTGINFAETSGQRRPDEDMLREEKKLTRN